MTEKVNKLKFECAIEKTYAKKQKFLKVHKTTNVKKKQKQRPKEKQNNGNRNDLTSQKA